MVGGPMKLAVNEWLMTPGALSVTAGLVSAGLAGIGAREIWHIVGGGDLSDDQKRELELLDQEAPTGFFGNAIRSVHCSLIAREMRGGGASPRVGWHRGLWKVKYLGHTWSNDPWVDPDAKAFDLTDISTPVMEDGKLVSR